MTVWQLTDRRAVGRLALGIGVVLTIAVISAAVVLTMPSATTGGGGGSGKMAVLATDPPYAGGGTKQYEHYKSVEAQQSNSGGQSPTASTTQSSSGAGWVSLDASGWLELNTLVNASDTVALQNVNAGTYDSVRFTFDQAIVTYNGQNYTAQTSSGQITAALTSNAQVSGGSTTVVLFDLRTVIVNAGSSSSPNFIATSSARAEVVPSGSVASASLSLGAKTDLTASSWFDSFVSGNAHLVTTAESLSSSSLSVTVKDTGTEASNVDLVIVTPVSVLGSGQVLIPGSLDGSAVFQPDGGGSLQASNDVAAQLSGGSGAAVSSASSSTFTYSGSIQFGTGISAVTGVQTGQSYVITVIGNNSVASSTVVAS